MSNPDGRAAAWAQSWMLLEHSTKMLRDYKNLKRDTQAVFNMIDRLNRQAAIYAALAQTDLHVGITAGQWIVDRADEADHSRAEADEFMEKWAEKRSTDE